MKPTFYTLALYVCLVFSESLTAATPGDENWDGAFGLPPGLNGDVYSTAILGNDLYVAGAFTKAGGLETQGIARWDGRSWFSVGGGVGGSVYTVVAQGKELYAGGFFTIGGSVGATNIAKWNGTQWEALGEGVPAFGPGPFQNLQYVFALALQGGKLYVGGEFHRAGSVDATNIAVWDGKNWSALGTGVSAGSDGPDPGRVYALVAQGPDLYAGGLFRRAGEIPCANVAHWDGKKWSDVGGGVSGGGVAVIIDGQQYAGQVLSLAIHKKELYAGGIFRQAGGVNARNLAKWNGTEWAEVGGGLQTTTPVSSEGVATIVPVDNDLHVAGYFNRAGDTAVKNIARWNGSSWSAPGSGVSGSIRSLAFIGKAFFAGGTFGLAGGKQAGFIAQWDGADWFPLGSGSGNALVPSVESVAANAGNVVVGGFLSSAGNIEVNNLVKLSGTNWSQVGNGIPGGFISKLAVAGANTYVAGNFVLPEARATNLACWNGSSWSSLGTGLQGLAPYLPGAYLTALAAAGNDLYVGGYFGSVGGVAATNLARWNGTNWSGLGDGLSNDSLGNTRSFPPSINAFAVSAGKLYVGGQFNRAGSQRVNSLAVWDGAAWSAINGGPFTNQSDSVTTLAVQGNSLFVAGYVFPDQPDGLGGFGPFTPLLVVWNGSSWSDPIATNIFISSMAMSGRNLYIGGYFTKVAGIAANNIARWNGANWFPLGSGLDGFVTSLAADGNTIYAGGYFSSAGSRSSYRFAAWHEP